MDLSSYWLFLMSGSGWCVSIQYDATAAKNGYYGSLVPMVRDAFLTDELVRLDCKGLERSDYKKIGCKLRVKLHLCILSVVSML